ncbi:hypothetical protein C8A01DRAFT_15088 [Parachaetomium inaequale]|uniref:Uncharacterized protein n=1 Tax=Parachaetomium inaequale TaxID=2588326 RepID=A0AAN6PHI2_9PEZI|nr:hypothetical protein C8A01DRAFT_15088 [Parachaetomium inaequale]
MATQQTTVTIARQPPASVQRSSTLAPGVKARVQIKRHGSLHHDRGSISATAAVLDMNDNYIAFSHYGGHQETSRSTWTAGEQAYVDFPFSNLRIHTTGTFRLRVSILHSGSDGAEVLGQVDSSIFIVVD